MKTSKLIGLLLVFLPICVWAENVSGLHANGNGSYLMKIDGKDFIAMSKADALKLNADIENRKQELAEAKEKLAKYISLSNEYEGLREKYVKLTGEYNTLAEDSIKLNGRYAKAADQLVTLNQDYSKLVHEYDVLAGKYRDVALRSSPREPLDVGLGAVNSNNTTRGVVMVGAGTHVFDVGVRAWLFGGQDNYGVILGTSF